MTTENRAPLAGPREARPAANFHAPAAKAAYGHHFSRIGIASVAAAAAQLRRGAAVAAGRRDLPPHLRDDDAA